MSKLKMGYQVCTTSVVFSEPNLNVQPMTLLKISVKEKIGISNKVKITAQMKRKDYKKLDISGIEKEPFNLKPYFKCLSVHNARSGIKIACKMTPTIPMNFHSDPCDHVLDVKIQ